MELNNTNMTHEETRVTNFENRDFRIAKITLYVLIFVLGCIGNSLVAIVIIGAKDMRTPPNFLILNLALCDFLTPALGIPFDFALEESKYIWPFGRVMCKVLWPLQTAFSTSSSLTLAVISLERFKTLSKPFAERITACKVVSFVVAIHALSLSLCIPYFFALDYNDSKSSCDESWPSVGFRQAYTIVLCLCEYLFPLITMCIAYLLIYRSLRSNLLRLMSRDSHSLRPRNVSKASEESTISKDSMEHRRKEQNIRLAKMFIIVVVVFAVSMFPNQILWLWVDYGNGKVHENFLYISVVCRLFTYANSVLNPFIYALKSKEFRSGFARIGRTSTMPLRKISSGTRRFVRKISRSVSDNQRAVPPVSAHSAQIMLLAQDSDVDTLDGKQTTHEIEVSNCDKDYKMECFIISDMSIDTLISEVLLTSNMQVLLEELRETDC